MYEVKFSKQFLKSMKGLDKQTSRMLMDWIDENLKGIENPRTKGRGLKGKLGDAWRYRIGDYRIIAKIEDDELIILLLDGGHRKEIYKRNQR